MQLDSKLDQGGPQLVLAAGCCLPGVVQGEQQPAGSRKGKNLTVMPLASRRNIPELTQLI